MNKKLEKKVEQAILKNSCTHCVFTAEVRKTVEDLRRKGMTYKQIIDFLLCDTE